jgi:hypothetical protein
MNSINQFLATYEQSFDSDGRKLISDFFITFSRFECALKLSITFANTRNNKVEASWDKFLSTIRVSFNKRKTKELETAVDYVLQKPPKVQTLFEEQITWTERTFVEDVPEINRLGLHIRDVRNNLFHGGKFDGRFIPEVSRNYVLLKSAILILAEWLESEENVKKNFLSHIV